MRVFDQKEICRNILSMAGMFCKSVFSVYVFDDFPRAVCSIRYTLSYVWMHTVLEKPPTGVVNKLCDNYFKVNSFSSFQATNLNRFA